MKIGIDCRLCGVRHAGIGRYVLNLVQRLPTLAPDVEWVFWFENTQQASEVSSAKNVTKLIAPIRHYTLAEQLQLPRMFAHAQLDLLHVPHFNVPVMYQGKLVVTIHDLLWHEQKGTSVTTLPEWQYWFKYAGYQFVTAQAVKKAQRIFVPTETVKATVRQHYPSSSKKITVTKEGATPLLPKPLTKAPASPQYTLVYIGSLYPHKNVTVIFEAMKLEPKLKLLVIGSRSVFQQQMRRHAQRLGVDERIEWLGYVADQELGQYLEQAVALVQPSLSEGFGLTGVEAMASGLPVLASAIPTFREIYGTAAEYFHPQQPAELVSAVHRLAKMDTKVYRQEIRDWAAQYSWDTMAAETLAVYRSVLT